MIKYIKECINKLEKDRNKNKTIISWEYRNNLENLTMNSRQLQWNHNQIITFMVHKNILPSHLDLKVNYFRRIYMCNKHWSKESAIICFLKLLNYILQSPEVSILGWVACLHVRCQGAMPGTTQSPKHNEICKPLKERCFLLKCNNILKLNIISF